MNNGNYLNPNDNGAQLPFIHYCYYYYYYYSSLAQAEETIDNTSGHSLEREQWSQVRTTFVYG